MKAAGFTFGPMLIKKAVGGGSQSARQSRTAQRERFDMRQIQTGSFAACYDPLNMRRAYQQMCGAVFYIEINYGLFVKAGDKDQLKSKLQRHIDTCSQPKGMKRKDRMHTFNSSALF